MEFAFPWPVTAGETLAWSVAAFTVLWGLFQLFAPRLTLRMMRLETRAEHPEALSEIRSGPGFQIGLGLSTILLAQPFLYFALGMAWAFTAFGRLISMMSDRGNTLYNWLMLVVALVLAALPLGYFLNVIP
jgi:hypothetical protein